MAFVAYRGGPDQQVFARVSFSSLEAGRSICWHDSSLYGLHDTNEERTPADDAWERFGADLASTSLVCVHPLHRGPQ
ncbi:Uncharacterised protein [Achromobacter sp. 2789STDY5608633]|nr:Uncharacterised protein [Achromobacter sp. 2789STDY5608633]